MESLEDYVPCYRKNDFEVSAVKQLLALSGTSSEYPKEYGDSGYLTISGKKMREKTQPVKDNSVTNQTSENRKSQDLAGLTTADVYELLRLKDSNENIAHDFCRWKLCPTIHAETVKHGIADASRSKPRHKKLTVTHRSLNSATGKLSARTSTPPSKLKTCLSTRLDSQRPSSVTSRPSSSSNRREELGSWQEPPPPIPIEFNFKYLKHPRQYSDQYREAYTYTKMKEKSLGRCSFIGGVNVPRRKIRYAKGKAMMICGKLSTPSTTLTCSDPDQVKSSMINWQLNHQLIESCDVELSVNNPSPTEIALLSKIPHIHRSSPSIPSNTNGKYGGKSTDKPYPFQLNISADAQTVIAPTVRKCGRPIFIH